MARLPVPRGPITEYLVASLREPPHDLGRPPLPVTEALSDDDLHLALYVCYELHYAGFEEVEDDWEWEPSLIAVRGSLERAFEGALRASTPSPGFDRGTPMADQLGVVERSDDGPSLSKFMQTQATREHFEEFLIHRSAYQLKEADPHTWAIPRVRGRAKAAMVEIQYDEYGSGRPDRVHSELFRRAMDALGLDATYGAYVDRIPGVTLATVNLMSMFGLHRRLRGATVGHLALFEMTSPIPNRRYATGLRRLGFGGEAVAFFDEHVVADSVHEVIAANDLAGALAIDEPELGSDILFGAHALARADARFGEHVLSRWRRGETSLISAPVRVG